MRKNNDFLRMGLDASFRQSMLKIMVMGHLKRHGAYPYAMLKHFKSVGWPGLSKLKKSDIYNVINSLEEEGFVRYSVFMDGARMHKRYRLTAKGMKVMKASKRIGLRALADVRRLIESEFR
jgi:DNA-binding PadR family transcriptional regulator